MDSTAEADRHQGTGIGVDPEGLAQGRMRSVSSDGRRREGAGRLCGELCASAGLGESRRFSGDDIGGEIAWSGGSVVRNG